MRNGLTTIGVCALALLGACSTTAGEKNRVDEVRRGVVDAAASPFRDIGLVRPEVPATLQGLGYQTYLQNEFPRQHQWL